jgi:hypothetical protein
MNRNKGLGSAWGSILAVQASVQAQEAATKLRVVKTESQIRQEEFDRIKREHERDFIDVERPASEYEQAVSGVNTVVVSMPRTEYEKRMGITEIRKIYSQSSVAIQEMAINPLQRVKMVDPTCRWPKASNSVAMSDENTAEFIQQAKTFLDSKNITGDDRDRIILFVGFNIDSNSFINALDPGIWQIGYDRLRELGCLNGVAEPTPAPTQVEQTIAELKETAENDWFNNQVGPLWGSFKDYLAHNFSFYPNEKQQRAFLDFIVSHGLQVLDPESFNIARRSLCKSGVIPAHCLLADEILADRVEKGEFRLDTESGRRAFQIEKNRLIYSESD